MIPTPCPKCRQNANDKQLSAQELKDLCVKLKCASESQENWANKFRAAFITYWVKSASDSQADTIRDVLKNETDGGWWMDHSKECKMDEFIQNYTPNEASKVEFTKKINEENTEEKSVRASNTVIFPDGYEFESDKEIVEISQLPSGHLMVKVDFEDTMLTNLLQQYMCQEISNYQFIKKINEGTGKYEDRATELALMLLDNQYPVDIKENKVRGQIALKYYKPQPERFIKYKDKDTIFLEWKGYNRILCNRALTFINGARWNEDLKTVVIKNGNKKQIEEFADINQFIITEDAKKVINQYNQYY